MRVLVAEDTYALAVQLRARLEEDSHSVDVALDGEQALYSAETEFYDAIVLDLGLPKLDGLTVLRRLRAAGRTTPVLILTARSGWSDKVDGLNAGADDYLAKPFAIAELLARVNALIRRSHGQTVTIFETGNLRIDIARQTVTVDGQPAVLTALEFKLLAALAHNIGQPVSKTRLTEHLYAQDFDRDSNTLEVIVSRLRRKLGEEAIATLRGKGYVLIARRDGATAGT